MSIQIVASSPKALEVAKEKPHSNGATYPFNELEVNQSFTLPKAEANVKSLQVIASRKSKGGKRFVVVVHDELSLVEVARTA